MRGSWPGLGIVSVAVLGVAAVAVWRRLEEEVGVSSAAKAIVSQMCAGQGRAERRETRGCVRIWEAGSLCDV